MSDLDESARNTIETIIVTKEDLPICCPMQGKPLWNAHPRVYLPLKGKGAVYCPYCSAKYVFQDES